MATTVLCFEALRQRAAGGAAAAAVNRRGPGRARPASRLEWSALGVGLVPFVVAVVRAAVKDWTPVGDAAYFTVRSADVFTAHHPLLGAWSSGSSVVGVPVNNLGPLQLDLLAPFTKLAPYLGTAIGSALHQRGQRRRRVDRRQADVPAGGRRRRDARHDAVRRLARAVVADRRPTAVRPGVAVVRPAVAERGDVDGRAGRRADRRRRRQSDRPDALHVRLPGGPRLRRRRRRVRDGDGRRLGAAWRPVAIWSLVLGALCWIQPLLDQFVGTGNLGTVLGTATDRPRCRHRGGRPGRRRGRPRAAVLAAWRRCARSCSRTTASAWPVRSRPCRSGCSWRTGVAVLGARAGAPAARAVGIASVVALGAALVAAARIPVSSFGLVPQNYYWAWSLAAFVSLAVVAGVCSLPAVATVLRRGTVARRRALLAGALAVVGAVAVWPRYPVASVADRRGRGPTCRSPAAGPARRRHRRRTRRRSRRGRLCRGRSSPTTTRT